MMLFQSHFGLILTLDAYNRFLAITEFQSHFGLILTLPHLQGESDEGYFNPILV